MAETVIEIPPEYKRLFDSDWREAAVYGGRFSLKSHTIARVLLIRARMAKIRVACFREFQNSIGDSSHQLLAELIKQYELHDFRVTDKEIVNTVNGSDFLFKGLYRNEQSIKSIEGIDIAWVEEAQTVSNESIETLTPTVRKPGSQIIYSYNRLVEEDPVHKRLVVEGRPNTLIIKTDYTLAEKHGLLPDEIKAEVESDKANRPGLYKHKWLGEPNTVEGRVYKDWQIIDDIPHEAELKRRGLDFGYTNDPTAIVAVYYYNGGYIVDEEVYQAGMRNSQIAETIKGLRDWPTPIIADSAEPKSIDEIKLHGVNITGVEKRGVGDKSFRRSVVDNLQDKRISVTKRSANLLKEYYSHMWATDREGKQLNEPQDGNDHAINAIEYALWQMRPQQKLNVFIPRHIAAAKARNS